MSPKHSVGFCPICGGGLCGIRICGVAHDSGDDSSASFAGSTSDHGDDVHGFVICDECDATWLTPDLETVHQYPEIEDARCPICSQPMWGPTSRWANWDDIQVLGWEFAVDRQLDATPDEGVA